MSYIIKAGTVPKWDRPDASPSVDRPPPLRLPESIVPKESWANVGAALGKNVLGIHKSVEKWVTDSAIRGLSLNHRVCFYGCGQCALKSDREWCRPGADAEGYSQADGNLRITPPPRDRLPQVMILFEHLRLLRDEVGKNDSEGYGGYWEVYDWAGRNLEWPGSAYHVIFTFKSFAFGLRCPRNKAIQWVNSPRCMMDVPARRSPPGLGGSTDKSAVRFGTWDLFNILRDALWDLDLDDDPNNWVGDGEASGPLFVAPFEGTTVYDPHGVFTTKGDRRGAEHVEGAESPGPELYRRATQHQVPRSDRKPITLHWAIQGVARDELLDASRRIGELRDEWTEAASTFHPCRHYPMGLFTCRWVGEVDVIHECSGEWSTVSFPASGV